METPVGTAGRSVRHEPPSVRTRLAQPAGGGAARPPPLCARAPSPGRRTHATPTVISLQLVARLLAQHRPPRRAQVGSCGRQLAVASRGWIWNPNSKAALATENYCGLLSKQRVACDVIESGPGRSLPESRCLHVFPPSTLARQLPVLGVTSKLAVCELHFKSDYILKETSCYDSKTGKYLTAPLPHPRLSEDAIPEIFPNCPAYLSATSRSRESPDTKIVRLENKMLEAAISQSVVLKNKEDRESSFDSLSELSSVLKNRKPSPFWTVIEKESTTIFANIDVECGPVITSSVVK
ncbi:hypothetical protein PR048_013399 [Dryococelus australis]|uniref:THAP-type domain-containing protein n=1 Tax=Dryococelus australis TaxID=614101 RepID=A0ABQ9HSW2_9NEOP|nr:hypothetical protein PR048_013399 [Dryococelus australis]